MSKAIMFCGRDEFGFVRPVGVTSDDSGNHVLRVVDAAPYLLEYGMFSTLVSDKYMVAPRATQILSENADRKYVSIYNSGNNGIVLSAEKTENNGIVIFPHERYEMNVSRGNLYRGAMYLSMLDGYSQQDVTTFVQGGIGNSGFSDSQNRTHTEYISVDVPEEGLAVGVTINSSVASIRNVATFDENQSLIDYEPSGGRKFPLQDGVYDGGSFIVTNPKVKYIAVSFCRTADATQSLTVADMSDTILTVTLASPTTVYIAEGE